MGPVDIILIVLLAAAVGAALRRVIKNKKRGGCGCGCGCDGCPGCSVPGKDSQKEPPEAP